MSTIEPGGIVQYEGDPARRRGLVTLGLALVVAAAVAAYLEPYFVLDRVRDAVRKNDPDALSRLVDPYVIRGPLADQLELGRPREGTRIEQRYDGLARFTVRATREWELEPQLLKQSTITFALERHGLSWRLAEITTEERTTDLRPGSPPPPISEPKGDELPRFGEYVYVEELPEVTHRVAPAYPAPARAAGVEGTVLVQALVGRDGLVHDARLNRSIPLLDEAALDAVRRWRFKPATAKGEPVAVWVAIPVKFTLH